MDAVLASHHVDRGPPPRLFDLAGLRTASIRDQMIRARLLVERLFSRRLISEREPLLVVGGGAGGVTATMTAAALGVPVLLCEARAQFFGVQLQSARIIDPVEYDWPHPHCTRGTFPFEAPPMSCPCFKAPRWPAQTTQAAVHTRGAMCAARCMARC